VRSAIGAVEQFGAERRRPASATLSRGTISPCKAPPPPRWSASATGERSPVLAGTPGNGSSQPDPPAGTLGAARGTSLSRTSSGPLRDLAGTRLRGDWSSGRNRHPGPGPQRAQPRRHRHAAGRPAGGLDSHSLSPSRDRWIRLGSETAAPSEGMVAANRPADPKTLDSPIVHLHPLPVVN